MWLSAFFCACVVFLSSWPSVGGDSTSRQGASKTFEALQHFATYDENTLLHAAGDLVSAAVGSIYLPHLLTDLETEVLDAVDPVKQADAYPDVRFSVDWIDVSDLDSSVEVTIVCERCRPWNVGVMLTADPHKTTGWSDFVHFEDTRLEFRGSSTGPEEEQQQKFTVELNPDRERRTFREIVLRLYDAEARDTQTGQQAPINITRPLLSVHLHPTLYCNQGAVSQARRTTLGCDGVVPPQEELQRIILTQQFGAEVILDGTKTLVTCDDTFRILELNVTQATWEQSGKNASELYALACPARNDSTLTVPPEQTQDALCPVLRDCLRSCDEMEEQREFCVCPLDSVSRYCEDRRELDCELRILSPETASCRAFYAAPSKTYPGQRVFSRQELAARRARAEAAKSGSVYRKPEGLAYNYARQLDGDPPCLTIGPGSQATQVALSLDCMFADWTTAHEGPDARVEQELRSLGFVWNEDYARFNFSYILRRMDVSGNRTLLALSTPFTASLRMRAVNWRQLSDKSVKVVRPVSTAALEQPDKPHEEMVMGVEIATFPANYATGGRLTVQFDLEENTLNMRTAPAHMATFDVLGWKAPPSPPATLGRRYLALWIALPLVTLLTAAGVAFWWKQRKNSRPGPSI